MAARRKPKLKPQKKPPIRKVGEALLPASKKIDVRMKVDMLAQVHEIAVAEGRSHGDVVRRLVHFALQTRPEAMQQALQTLRQQTVDG